MQYSVLLLLVTSIAAAGCRRLERPARAEPPAETAYAGSTPQPSAFEQLETLGAKVRRFTPKPPVADALGCGVEHGVMILRGPTGVRYSKAPRVRGAFALKLARLEAIAQEEARAVFKRRLVRIEHAGTYVCRTIAASSTASQHAFGNAIDVTAFVLKGGRRISIGRDFVRDGYAPEKPGGVFLARVLQRVYAERLFRTVLTPDWDTRHAGHLHLDDRPGGWWRRFWGS